MELIDSRILEPAELEKFRDSFQNARPYKHLVIDNFLKPGIAESLYAQFPAEEKFNKHYKGLNEYKSEGSNFKDFPEIFSKLRDELASKEFTAVLDEITGMEGLYSVPDALGAGLHQGGNGSFLDIHIDFNIHVEQNIHRRLNVLVFLNKNWKEEYGGHSELWNADMTKCEKKVLPAFNRCLMFETNEISYHGYSKINIPEGESRKSMYTYYYTDLRPENVKYHDTVFKARPTDSTFKKVITPVKEKAKNFIKAQLKKLGITFK